MALILHGSLIGCRPATQPVLYEPPRVDPEYARPLEAGGKSLVLVDPMKWPDVEKAYEQRDDGLIEAIDRSMLWFDIDSTQKHFPIAGFTHEQVKRSVAVFRELVVNSQSSEAFLRNLRASFDLYQSVGWNNSGEVLFTAYYTPEFAASATRTGRFKYPLYIIPPSIVMDETSGKTIGMRVGDQITAPPTRRQIEEQELFSGHELVWLSSRFSQYLAHIQGSARLELTDGTVMYVGYAGNNGYEYTSVAKALVADGKIDGNKLSLPAVQKYFRDNPQDLKKYLWLNDRFIFFTPYQPEGWPSGSLGFKVTPMRTLATDKAIFPRGAAMLIDTTLPDTQGDKKPFVQFVVDQDTGGAIRAPGRADLYIGIGREARLIAGNQYAEGKMYYLILKSSAMAAPPITKPAIPDAPASESDVEETAAQPADESESAESADAP